MFDQIFENRNKKLVNILKIADYLGRSLRENVEVFSIDDSTQETIFITEGDKIIKGTYDFSDGVSLKNILVEDADVFSDDKQFDTFVSNKVSGFVKNIYEDSFIDAENSFDNILSLWENRAKFFNVKNRLLEKSEKLHARKGIIATNSYQRFVEVAPLVVDFLAENRDAISTIPEVKNSIILANTIATAFNCPRLEYEDLVENKEFSVEDNYKKSIYEMVCSQELVRKELYETKQDFANIWINEEKVSALAGCVFEQDSDKVEKKLIEAVEQVPYLALSSKKELRTVIANSLQLQEDSVVSKKDLNSFISYLFEVKKPLKTLFVRSLNEKYGVNVQNLKEIPSFKSLANTQVVLFECLSKVAPKNSAIKEVLKETARLLKDKDGVECLDVNEDIKLLFSEAEFEGFVPDNDIDTLNFSNISSYCSNVDELVSILSEKEEIPEYDEDRVEDIDQDSIEAENSQEDLEEFPDYDEDAKVVDGAELLDTDSEINEKRKKKLSKKQKKVMDVEPAPEGDGDIDAKDLAKLRQNEQAPVETEEPEQEEKVEKEEEDKKQEINPDEYMKALKELEDALTNLDISGDAKEEEEEEGDE